MGRNEPRTEEVALRLNSETTLCVALVDIVMGKASSCFVQRVVVDKHLVTAAVWYVNVLINARTQGCSEVMS